MIPAQKDMPPFSVHQEDSGGHHCCEEVTAYDPISSEPVFESIMFGLDGRIELVDVYCNDKVEIAQNLT